MHQKASNQTAIAFANYTYDNDGNRTSMTNMDGMHAYSYDRLNRLTSASHPAASGLTALNETFAFDPIGNRTADALRTNYQYDAANRITSDSSMTYTSDANGDRTSQTSRATGQTTNFKYDSANRLIEVDGTAGTIATYKFDPLGHRIEKNVGGTITRFLYDGQNIRTILDGNNNVLAQLTYVPGIPTPLAMIVPQTSRTDYVSGTYFFHKDVLGSVVALTDQNGNIVETYEYAAFGRASVKDAQGAFHDHSIVGNPFMYAGSYYDPETGFNHMGVREQDPDIGNFIQEDPIAFAGGDINLYAYTRNQPINYRDPSGLIRDTGEEPYTQTATNGTSGTTSPPNYNSPVNYADPLGLNGLGNYSAGFGDTVSGGGTAWIRNQWSNELGITDSVDPNSSAYRFGQWTAAGWAVIGAGAVLGRLAGYGVILALHPAHHDFGALGRLAHFQINVFKFGVKNSGRACRIPLPWK